VGPENKRNLQSFAEKAQNLNPSRAEQKAAENLNKSPNAAQIAFKKNRRDAE
jgi:hypothetical protein